LAKPPLYGTLTGVKLNPDRLLRPLVISLLVVTSLWLAATVISRRLSPPTPQASLSPLDVPPDCPAALTQDLLARGVSATAQFAPSGTLLVIVPSRDPSGTPPNQSAQVIWTVFDAAAALPAECPFRHLEVTVETENLHMQASVAGEALRGWAQGRTDNEALIEQTTYTEATPQPTQR
jgi:hypothetical protein